jgi:hypothetical protein
MVQYNVLMDRKRLTAYLEWLELMNVSQAFTSAFLPTHRSDPSWDFGCHLLPD